MHSLLLYSYAEPDGKQGKEEKPEPEANFALSGKLAAESNTVKGVVLVHQEPPEARKPSQMWRLYGFKNGEPPSSSFPASSSSFVSSSSASLSCSCSLFWLSFFFFFFFFISFFCFLAVFVLLLLHLLLLLLFLVSFFFCLVLCCAL